MRTIKLKNKKLKNKYEMKNSNNLLCCINSLHYLKDNKFDYIIIDEIETVNNKWYDNETISQNPIIGRECWDTYIRIIKDAERVFFIRCISNKYNIKIY